MSVGESCMAGEWEVPAGWGAGPGGPGERGRTGFDHQGSPQPCSCLPALRGHLDRSCRYLLTLASAVKTDWVYWRDVRLEVGETS